MGNEKRILRRQLIIDKIIFFVIPTGESLDIALNNRHLDIDIFNYNVNALRRILADIFLLLF